MCHASAFAVLADGTFVGMQSEEIPAPAPEQPADKPPAAPAQNPEKPKDEWMTGDEPMTGPQASYLQTLCQEAGVDFDDSLSKAAASKRIDELQAVTNRGGPQPDQGDREQ